MNNSGIMFHIMLVVVLTQRVKIIGLSGDRLDGRYHGTD